MPKTTKTLFFVEILLQKLQDRFYKSEGKTVFTLPRK
jgi:hypothetical protein